MKKVLITGFEPFGNYKENPSQEIAEGLNGQEINGYLIIGKSIPLRYKEIQEEIIGHIEGINPEIIINLGLAPRPSIALERVALNIADVTRSAYNCGSRPEDEKLVEDGPTAYLTTLPIKKIKEHLNSKGIPCFISNSAGTYGCNQIFYYTMNHLDRISRLDSVKAGFIHVPLTPKLAIENFRLCSMDLSLMKKAIWLTLEFLTGL
ncbi:MAG: pyroglutamyl-peptidase I family protein [Candidatus Hodarchaeales archaeon]